MKVVVVAKTRMGQNLCVGAVVADNGQLLRLIPREGSQYHSWTEFNAAIGELIEIDGNTALQIDPPHIEDYLVTHWASTGEKVTDVSAWIRDHCTVWQGDRQTLFDGRLRFTSRGKGHIDRDDPLPANSVGFWEIPEILIFQSDDRRYILQSNPSVNVKYTGFEDPPSEIPRGTIVRLSLSRWWAPDDKSIPEACWLQLSGHY